jgi:lipoprotein-releasing system ATP-binding protein
MDRELTADSRKLKANAQMSDSIIAQDVTKSFARDGDRVDVLKGVSLAIAAGELAAIVGPSGVGKSTLLHLLGGLERPTAGAIRYGDTDLAALSDVALARFRNRRVGFVFQFHHLLPEFSALENVMMPLLIRRRSTAEARARSTTLLGRVGLAARLKHRPGELSGGEQQRVAIARALIGDPSVLLADEPTGNLDSRTGDEVFELMRELNRERRLTCVFITHNDELARRTDRVLRMLDGRMVE